MSVAYTEIMLFCSAVCDIKRRMNCKEILLKIVPMLVREIGRHHSVVKVYARLYGKTSETMLQVDKKLVFVGVIIANLSPEGVAHILTVSYGVEQQLVTVGFVSFHQGDV